MNSRYLSSVIGPMIGGALARPCVNYPEFFQAGSIWDKYPYLLPNLFSALIVLVGVVNGLLFLEETHAQKRDRRDRGLELGGWLLARLPKFRRCTEVRDEKSKMAEASEIVPLLDDNDEQLPGYRTNEHSPSSSPRLKSIATRPPCDSLDLLESNKPIYDTRSIFTRQVVLNIMSFGLLAL
jgi:hypothetical protein